MPRAGPSCHHRHRLDFVPVHDSRRGDRIRIPRLVALFVSAPLSEHAAVHAVCCSGGGAFGQDLDTLVLHMICFIEASPKFVQTLQTVTQRSRLHPNVDFKMVRRKLASYAEQAVQQDMPTAHGRTTYTCLASRQTTIQALTEALYKQNYSV